MKSEAHFGRLLSLDAFRGFTIAAMILVNSPGTHREVYTQLTHVSWHGWHFADTIFPGFLFIMGVSTALSFAARRERGIEKDRLDFQILRRALVLFGLGLFVNGYPIFHFSTIRLPGVLQRIALCYLFASLIASRCGPRGQICWLIGLLVSYWLLVRFYPVPGTGAGVFDPGDNFVSYVDSFLPQEHLWAQHGTQDPEGLVSTLPAIATTLFGVLTGGWLLSSRSGRAKTAGMLCAGLMLVILGMALDPYLPINKKIWTSTFSILMGGLSLFSFGVFYWLIDMAGWRLWARPLVIFGMNALPIYVLSEVLDSSLRFVLRHAAGSTVSLRWYLFTTVFAPVAGPQSASLLFALSYVFLVFLIAWSLWRMRIFIKV